MSTLQALLVFGGIPLGILVAIALLVSAPSVVRGPRYRPGADWDAAPLWFGGPEQRSDEDDGSSPATKALTSGTEKARRPARTTVDLGDDSGGASARW